jgi:hypothetical protein
MTRTDMKKVRVHCYQGTTLLKSYDFGVPVPADPRAFRLPTKEYLEGQVKTFLTNDGLAFPPYTGITFRIDYYAE